MKFAFSCGHFHDCDFGCIFLWLDLILVYCIHEIYAIVMQWSVDVQMFNRNKRSDGASEGVKSASH